MKKIILLVLLIIFFIRPLFVLYEHKDNFFSKGYESRYEDLKAMYYSSQYMKKQKPAIIPDETLESFAAGAFLKGMNPILIVHDQPPLGRYITAFSIYLFDNPNTIILGLLLLSLIGIYLVAYEVFKNATLSVIPMGLFANESLFLNKFHYIPLLEPIQLPFIIFALFFFIKGVKSKKNLRWFLLTSFMLGFVISIRFFVLGGVLVVVMLFYLFIFQRDRKTLFKFLLSLPLALFVLIASYTRTIQLGYSVFSVFGIQKYILTYHKSKFVLPFTFWDLLLFNRWHTWWGNYAISFDPEWTILWPLFTILSFLSVVLSFIKKIKLSSAEIIVLLWIIAYSLMLSAGYTSTRYFLPLTPFLYIMGISFLYKAFRVMKNREK